MKPSNRIKWDGHTHTEFCRHGSDAPMEAYLEQAIRQGFERYSITEHPPLPDGWVDNPEIMAELAMPMDDLGSYLDRAWACKTRYAQQLDIAVGLELDFLHGAEDFSRQLLAACANRIEDLVVSVHYLPGKHGMRCVDLSASDFTDAFFGLYGSFQETAAVYFDHVEAAIHFAASLPGRKRIGHIQLIEKFRRALPPLDAKWLEQRTAELIPLLEASGVGVDVNTAGLRKELCGKPYVPEWFVTACRERGIECVFGSDAHRPEDVGAGWDWYAAIG